jgi:hypothetical protein
VAADPGDLIQAVHHRQDAARISPVSGSTAPGADWTDWLPAWTAAPGPPPGLEAGGCAAGIAAIVSSISVVSWSIWPLRASIWSSSILASSA